MVCPTANRTADVKVKCAANSVRQSAIVLNYVKKKVNRFSREFIFTDIHNLIIQKCLPLIPESALSLSSTQPLSINLSKIGVFSESESDISNFWFIPFDKPSLRFDIR